FLPPCARPRLVLHSFPTRRSSDLLGEVVAAVPMPVLGGAGFILFGTVTGSGIRSLKTVSFEGNMNLIIVSSSLAFEAHRLQAAKDRKSTRLNSSHVSISYAVFCLN